MAASRTDNPQSHNFEYMLCGLLGLLVAGPALRTVAPSWSPTVLWITMGVAIAAGVSSLVTSFARRVIGCFAGAAFAACGVFANQFEIPELHVVAAVGFLLFCLWGIIRSLLQVLIGPRVDLNRIAGAVCVYILMGLFWAVLYMLLALSANEAFAGVSGDSFADLWSQLMYFSFVTLTTLGYGDVSPLIPMAQSLAFLEAVVGQLYVAILIAGLVGAHLNSRTQ